VTVTIAFLGDGLTVGGQWENWFPEYDILNLAVAKNTTDDVLSGLDVLVQLNPNAIVIGVGTNDLGWRKNDEYVVRNLETIMHSLRKRLPETRIMMQSLLPRGKGFADTIRSINRHICQYAPTQHVRYLDLWPTLATPDGELRPEFTNDQLHLTDAGYEAWVGELRPGLERLFELPPSSTSIPIQHA